MKKVKIFTRSRPTRCGSCDNTKREAAKAVADGLVFELEVTDVTDPGNEPIGEFLGYYDEDAPLQPDETHGWRAMPVVKVYDENDVLIEAWAGHKVGKLTALIAA